MANVCVCLIKIRDYANFAYTDLYNTFHSYNFYSITEYRNIFIFLLISQFVLQLYVIRSEQYVW